MWIRLAVDVAIKFAHVQFYNLNWERTLFLNYTEPIIHAQFCCSAGGLFAPGKLSPRPKEDVAM